MGALPSKRSGSSQNRADRERNGLHHFSHIHSKFETYQDKSGSSPILKFELIQHESDQGLHCRLAFFRDPSAFRSVILKQDQICLELTWTPI